MIANCLKENHDISFKGSFIVLFIVLFLSPRNSLAQQKPKDWSFNVTLKETNMKFSIPKGYTGLDGLRSYQCGDGKLQNALLYSIVNGDSSIVIAFSVMSMSTSQSTAIIKRINPNYDFNKNFMVSAKHLADTINNKIVNYSKTYAKEKFNADNAGEYVRLCNILYRNRYPFMRVVFGHKQDVTQFEITYFYTEESKNKINEVIKETAGILKFSDTPINENNN